MFLISAPEIAADEMFADCFALLPTGLDDETHSSPNDVANDPPNQREPTPPLVPDYREGNTSKPLNYFNVIEADLHPGKEHVHAHQTEQVTLNKQEYILLPLSQMSILKLMQDLIIIDESMSATDVPCCSDQFVVISNLR
ncbi:hypothetical protein AJ78_04263 [Emergomyces pasteurianus Ep9510]|uniref:Uncharacterized protein n=1 Tax=Emergomyces pasteurianus Ep9510 TaxID=1447872 RepID=A0A1J9QHR9_9EURO|nr:hypothetical protein AJ78_04263 [Emergomyces pasteurianus Ep9510]